MASTLKLGARGLELIKSFESFCPHVYDDALPMISLGKGKGRQYREWMGERVIGTLTIGYGHTNWDGPPKIKQGLRMSEGQASIQLDQDLDVCEREVNAALEDVPLNQDQFDALVSFHYNTGALTPKRQITQYLRRAQWHLAMRQLLMFRRGNGVVLKGLERRRAAELALFESRWSDALKLMDGDAAPQIGTDTL